MVSQQSKRYVDLLARVRTSGALVFGNATLGTIRMHQEREYPGRVSATTLVNPDFAAMAKSFGGFGATVEQTADFAPAFLVLFDWR